MRQFLAGFLCSALLSMGKKRTAQTAISPRRSRRLATSKSNFADGKVLPISNDSTEENADATEKSCLDNRQFSKLTSGKRKKSNEASTGEEEKMEKLIVKSEPILKAEQKLAVDNGNEDAQPTSFHRSMDIEDLPVSFSQKGPTKETARQTTEVLARFYRDEDRVRHPKTNRRSVLDSLIATILSQATSNTNSSRAFKSLKDSFPEWKNAIDAGAGAIEKSIRCGGLAEAKSKRIHSILQQISNERGECSLEHLRDKPDDEVKEYLCKFPGVGPKTAACVLMFGMQREEFPVDTHVRRITTRLGWLPEGSSAEHVYMVLNNVLPNEVKYDLHVLLIEHGRRTCKSRQPLCESCPLQTNCALYAKRSRELQSEQTEEYNESC